MQINPIVSLINTGLDPVYSCKFLRTPDLPKEGQKEILNSFFYESYWQKIERKDQQRFARRIAKENSLWYASPGICYMEWDMKSLAEVTFDIFINRYIHSFVERLQVPLQIGNDRSAFSEEKGFPDTDNWVYAIEVNSIEWWWLLESEENTAKSMWLLRLERYVRILNIITTLLGTKNRMYYEDQGDEVVLIILSDQTRANLMRWNLMSFSPIDLM